MIETQKISKNYGSLKALNDVSLNISKGDFYGILGPNGAGKTTLINIVSTLIKPDSGTISIDGYNVLKESKEVKKLIGLVPQELAIYEDLTALYNLTFWCGFYHVSRKEIILRAKELLEITGLADRANDKVSTFSGGMKRRINIACALMHKPPILIMDEPTAGIDLQSRELIYKILKDIQDEGHTIIYTSHYLDEFEKLCNRIAVMDKGKIIAEGTVKELIENHGKGDIIFIEVEDHVTMPIFDELKEFKIQKKDRLLIIETPDSNTSLPKLTKILNAKNIQIKHIEIQRAGLENVFFNLTGTYLRD